MLADYGWEYDDNDKITKLTLGHLGIEATYAYDLRGRLKTETLTGNGDGQTPPPWTNVFGGPATRTFSTPLDSLRSSL